MPGQHVKGEGHQGLVGNWLFWGQNRHFSLRGALPRTPLGLAPQTPVLQVVC